MQIAYFREPSIILPHTAYRVTGLYRYFCLPVREKTVSAAGGAEKRC